jgi:outer membrane protein OmpA-like peptidoglycan-associated protein
MNFTPLSSYLSNEAMTELDKAFDYFMENPDARIQIDGHTDAVKHYDQALSEA